MKSVAETILKGFELSPTFRPSAMEDVIVGLVSTLAQHALLDEALEKIEHNSDLKFTGNTTSLKDVASHPYIPYLHRAPNAITLLLHLIPKIAMVEQHSIVSLPEEALVGAKKLRKRNLIKSIDAVNRANFGIKLYIPYATTQDIGIIAYTDRDDLITILGDLALPTQLQDKILQ